MPIDQKIKDFAYELDRDCWRSYSGRSVQFKQYMEKRRQASLEYAAWCHSVPYAEVPMPVYRVHSRAWLMGAAAWLILMAALGAMACWR